MNEQKTFDEQLMQLIKKNIVKQLSNVEFLKVDYSDRISLPSDFLQQAYRLIDKEKIMIKVVDRLEEELANTMVNKVMTEYKNDIKDIMCNRELRNDLKYFLRRKIEETTGIMMEEVDEE